MIALRPRLSKSSRDALAAADEVKRRPKGSPVDDIVRANISAVVSPTVDTSADERALDEEIERMLSAPKLAEHPYAGLTSPSDGRPKVWRGIWQQDSMRAPSPPLSPEQLESIAERTSASRQKHIHRMHMVELERRKIEGARSPEPQLVPRSRSASALSPPASPSATPTFDSSTSSREIYMWERKAFGREPITNRAPLLRYAGDPRSPSPTSSGMHLDRVRTTAPPAASARRADYFSPPSPSKEGLRTLAPKLAEFFERAPLPPPHAAAPTLTQCCRARRANAMAASSGLRPLSLS
jgi:hypothetical protein